MYYTIYKITNKINQKYYIGKHQTINLDDCYMGSGKILMRAQKKYGIENFTKEILFIFDNEEEMNQKEKELVVVSEETYNLCEGGKGGFSYINRTGKNIYEGHANQARKNVKKATAKAQELMKNDEFKIIFSEKISKRMKEYYKHNDNPFLGKTHSEETKRKIGLANKNKQQGKNNSQYGTCWITNGIDNKKINKIDLIRWTSDGYRLGRC